ncbi:MAG TPA: hypothetical protein VFS64_02055 [Solirubrobacterales bacterium]|nr:hypothetical protein [Solirubrobacterales bacterium]
MRVASKHRPTALHSMKENLPMKTRLLTFAATLCAAVILLTTLPLAFAPADEPWWQVLDGSRPTNMWEPGDALETQEVAGESLFGLIYAVKVEVAGQVVGCLGSGTLVPFGGPSADEVCEGATGSPASESAPEFREMLESPYGAGEVQVSGGPAGSAPFVVEAPWGPPIELTVLEAEAFGLPTGVNVGSEITSEGSGRLVLSFTNLGDAPVDGTSSPVTIVDRLPEGVAAYGVEAFAGPFETYGSSAVPPTPVECALEAADEVVCSYEGKLPPYEAIEIEIPVSLTGTPPTAGAPGQVTISGGGAASASAEQTIQVSPEPTPFGVEQFSAVAESEGGDSTRQAGSHPFQFTTTLQLNAGREYPSSALGQAVGSRAILTEQPALPRNLRFPLPAGLVGNANAMPRCDMATFLRLDNLINECPDKTVVGASSVTVIEDSIVGLFREAVPVFNLSPAHGEPARFGFVAGGAPVVIDTAVDPADGYRITARVSNVTQIAQFLSATTAFWGTPSDPRHDNARGWNCVYYGAPGVPGDCERPAALTEPAFMRMPVQCADQLDFGLALEPWNVPLGSQVEGASFTGDRLGGCNRVPFDPSIESAATSKLAGNPSGLDFQLDMPNSGLLSKEAIAEGQAKKVEVTLPEGMTINPSEGEGLVGCSPADYARETASSLPGEGCPEASKIGTVQISTPLLEEEAHGALYVATPFDNPSGSLVALYMVAKIPDRGIVVKQAGVVKPDPVTGQLTTTFDDLPQLPFSSFELHFKEGGRAPLVTPPACGRYDVVARFTPWSAEDPNNPAPDEVVTRNSSFDVERGVDGGACPMGGTPPFHPGLLAGTINNAAGEYSPFNVRLTRNDGEQEFTNFSIKLPPGVVGKLAGIPFCSDAVIAAAKSRTGPNGGQEELDNPSCPAASQVGRTLVGAGVGASLTYVPGKVYLAGPYHGSPLSVVAITAAKVGPFDLGTVVVRDALRINPETAEVFVDATGSDPIPHIIQGIPVHARDIRVYVDRNEFVLNPTSCERTSTASTVLGSGLDFGSSADDQPVTATSPFQAADCANLGFKPRLQLKLRGKTNRGGNPALRAVMRPRKGDANAARISVALPHSEFLDQGHIRTVCTRVQFKAGAGNGAECPQGAIYGHAKVWTPLFEKPLEGPVFLRSSEHPLPDLVLALHGLVDIDAVSRIDSVGGGIRNTFDFVPDAPVTKVVLSMQGGKKGLLENSTDICRGKHQATVKMEGHNGRLHNFLAPLKPKCPRRHARRP